MTTTFSWRYVFVGEVVIVIAILLLRRTDAPRSAGRALGRSSTIVAAGLSALGLGLIVFGILKSSSWGWFKPIGAPSIGGTEITPFGFSVVPFLILGGFVLLALFSTGRNGEPRRAATSSSTAAC